jgi:hypothetical protein
VKPPPLLVPLDPMPPLEVPPLDVTEPASSSSPVPLELPELLTPLELPELAEPPLLDEDEEDDSPPSVSPPLLDEMPLELPPLDDELLLLECPPLDDELLLLECPPLEEEELLLECPPLDELLDDDPPPLLDELELLLDPPLDDDELEPLPASESSSRSVAFGVPMPDGPSHPVPTEQSLPQVEGSCASVVVPRLPVVSAGYPVDPRSLNALP